MSTVVEFLENLRAKDIKVWLEEDRLRINAPKGAIDNSLKAELGQRKLEIIDYLNMVASIPTGGLPPLVSTDHSKPLPLSFTQQRLWFLDQLEPNSTTYNMPIAMRLEGKLIVTALEKSLLALVQRHEVLRTTFSQENGRPIQVIHPALPQAFEQIDLRQYPVNNRVEIATKQIMADANQPFDLENDFLIRAKLFQIDESEHILLITQHHIVTDRWSLALTWHELTSLYNEFVTGVPASLPDLPIQYADYAVWQQSWLTSDEYKKQLNYWKNQLNGTLPTLELPLDHPRPVISANRGGTLRRTIPMELTRRINQLGQTYGATSFMTILAAFEVLLYRYTGQEDLLIGTSIANRNRVETSALIGFFVNTLLLRTDLSGQPTFVKLLKHVRQTALDAFAHQDMPIEKLIEQLQPDRDVGRAALFDVLFIFQNTPTGDEALANLSSSQFPLEFERAMFDLTWYVAELDDSLTFTIEYDAELFEKATIDRMFAQFEQLLTSITIAPQQPITKLMLLPPDERLLLDKWRRGQSIPLPPGCVHQWFERHAETIPDKTAVSHDHQQLSYAELNARANQLAHYLIENGVEPDTIVGLHLPRSIEMIVALLGILKAGGAYLPLDPTYPANRLQFMIDDAQPALVLTLSEFSLTVPEGKQIQIVNLAENTQFVNYPSNNPETAVSRNHLAYIIYTSGSTGKPKGVLIEHGAMATFVHGAAIDYPITHKDRVLQFATIAFDTAVEEIYPCLTQGGTLVLRTDAMIDTMENFLQKCAEWEISVLDLPTAFWHHLTVSLTVEQLSLPSSIKLVIIGGEKANEHALHEWQQQVNKDVRLLNTYGPTEATVVTTMFEPKPESAVETISKGVLIGRPLPNYEVFVFDPARQPVPIGVPGELMIGGPGLARGYLNRPELTEEKFISNPFGNGRLYRTGDLVSFLPDGNIEFMGRTDDQVKIRGYRIELGEIEAVLAQHPHIQQAVVVAYEPPDADKQLAAYLITQEEINIDELQQYLQSILPAYMIPASFTMLDTFPLMPNGKVDRKALPKPDRDVFTTSNKYVAPRTKTEMELASIWADVLKVEQVGIHDDFFMLGGHSLLATSVISRIRHTFPIEIPLRMLFEKPTVADLAEIIDSQSEKQTTIDIRLPLRPIAREGAMPTSFAQERLWFLDQYEPNSAGYILPSITRAVGNLDLKAVQQSINEIVRRHESLRTRFVATDGIPYQVIEPATAIEIPLIDLSHLPEDKQEHEIKQIVQQEAQRPFNLQEDVMLRVILLRLSTQEHIFIFTTHHIASDGWSFTILSDEFVTLYEAFKNGAPSPLPELPVQYADFAAWQRQWLQGEVLETHLTYWKESLAGIETLQLPTDRPRPALQSFNGSQQTWHLPDATTQGLQALSTQADVTLFMIMLAAFEVLLHRYSRQEDFGVGIAIANRIHPDLEKLIGFFANTLVMRADLSGDPTFLDLLPRVRSTALGAYEHQDIPFEKLVAEIQPERDLSQSPLFQVLFSFLDNLVPTKTISGLTVSPLSVSTGTANFDMSLYAFNTTHGIQGRLEYNTDLFDDNTIQQLLTHFMIILESIVADPTIPVSALAILPEQEKQHLLTDLNETQRDYPQDACIHDLFAAQVQKTPEKTAVFCQDQTINYQQLNQRADQLAHHLRQLGVGPDVIVGICLTRSIDMVVSVLAVMKAGGAYLPLDPAYPIDRLTYMMTDSQAPVLITESSLNLTEALSSNLPQAPAALCIDTDWTAISDNGSSTPAEALSFNPENLAYVIYTSGSTGKPKGVQISHRAAVNFLLSMQNEPGLTSEDLLFSVTTLSFDIAVLELYLPLISGAQLIIVPRAIAYDGRRLMQELENSSATVMQATPVTWRMLVDAGWQGDPDLKILCGGEAMPPDLAESLLTRCGELWNMYGPTETTVWSTIRQIKAGETAVNIGRPIANTSIYILDKHLQPVPRGVAGEMFIGGDGVARGYHHRPELTAERFITNPFNPSERIYRTGDLARYLPNGEIDFLGRIDHQIKIRGFRVELGEIDAVLTAHEAISEVVTIVREDEPGNKQLVAYIICQDTNNPPPISELQDFAEQQLPGYMVPTAFVFLDQFPKTPNRKIDRKALPAPDLTRDNFDTQFIPPRNPVEEMVAMIMAEVLNLDEIGMLDNFFRIGGHSLLATRLLARIFDTFKYEVTLRDFFESPTVSHLAEILVADPAQTQRIEKTAVIHLKLANLSDEEIAQMLQEKRQAKV